MKFVLTTFFLLTFSVSFSQTDSYFNVDNTKQKMIKMIGLDSCVVVTDNFVSKAKFKRTFHYAKSGHITYQKSEVLGDNDKFSVEREYWYYYNQSGNLILSKEVWIPENRVDSIVYSYNENQQLSLKIQYTTSKIDTVKINYQDGVIAEELLNGDLKFSYIHDGNKTNKTDASGRVVMTFENGRVIQDLDANRVNRYEYEENGNLIAVETSKDGKINMTSKIIYQYGLKDRLESFNAQGLTNLTSHFSYYP